MYVCKKHIQRKQKPTPAAAEASEEFQWEATDDDIPILKDNLQDKQDSGEPKQESLEQEQEMPLKKISHEEREPQEQETSLMELESDAEGDEVLLSGVAAGASQKLEKSRPPRLSLDSSQDYIQADDIPHKVTHNSRNTIIMITLHIILICDSEGLGDLFTSPN